jgi:hypothetical protein
MHMAAVVGVLPGMAREPKGFASRLAWLLRRAAAWWLFLRLGEAISGLRARVSRLLR